MPCLLRNKHHEHRARKDAFTGCPASNCLFLPPPLLSINYDRWAAGSFYTCSPPARELTPQNHSGSAPGLVPQQQGSRSCCCSFIYPRHCILPRAGEARTPLGVDLRGTM